MINPLLPFDSIEERYPYSNKYVVWRAILDKIYLIEVQRIDDSKANLCIFNHNENDKLLWIKEVSLSFGAMWGPDYNDVIWWKDLVCEIIDGHKYD